MGWDAESMRQAIRNDKLSFATGYQQDSGKWVFVVDRNAFEKCLAGTKDLFK